MGESAGRRPAAARRAAPVGGECREPASPAGERPLRPGRGPGGTVARDPSADAVSAAHCLPQDAGIAHHDHPACSAPRLPVRRPARLRCGRKRCLPPARGTPRPSRRRRQRLIRPLRPPSVHLVMLALTQRPTPSKENPR